jgi:hypothetical protein
MEPAPEGGRDDPHLLARRGRCGGAAMEPAPEGGRDVDRILDDATVVKIAAMEPAPEGGRDLALVSITAADALPQWSPPRRAGGTSPAPRRETSPRRRNGARPGGREGPRSPAAAPPRAWAAMEPAPEGGRDAIVVAQQCPRDLVPQWSPPRRAGGTPAPTPRPPTRPAGRNGARPGGREGPLCKCTGAHLRRRCRTRALRVGLSLRQYM